MEFCNFCKVPFGHYEVDRKRKRGTGKGAYLEDGEGGGFIC